MEENVYFAADKPKHAIRTLQDKASDWFTGVTDISYLDKIKRSWRAYYGEYYGRDGFNDHEISFGGEDGEIVNLAVNHYRNIARHIHVMVTSTKPAFQCRAINTDRKSLIQAKLGNGLLDYYMREMRLESILKDAVEYAIVMGSAYIKLEWNSTKGKIHDYIEPSEEDIVSYDEDDNPLDKDGLHLKPFPIYDGDVAFSLLSPFDVVYDPTKEYFDKNDWVICRTFINKFDLAAKYPEHAKEILAVDSKDKQARTSRVTPYSKHDETVDIPVYEFFHNRTEALPDGRYMLYVSEDIALEDTVLPYREMPIYRIVSSSIIGTPYGYTDMFDLLPLQEMLNSLYSTAATNINAFGVQSILSPRGCDIEAEQMGDGMQFIEYNATAGKPEAMQLTATSAEVYNMMTLIEKGMETISGVNAVARGNPDAALRSGNALALVQSQALQYVSGLQQSYIRLIEDVGTGLINLLKDFAQAPRIAAIAGLNNTTEMREFKSDDIKSINRVVVDAGNALMNTTAGRVQVADNLLQMGAITDIDKYLMVINTGNLDYVTEGTIDHLALIKAENEAMVKGEAQQAIWSERHSKHIAEHMGVLNDPILKQDADLVKRVLDHVQEHANLLRTTDPFLLQVIGEAPLPPTPQQAPPMDPAAMPAPAMGPDQGNFDVMDPNAVQAGISQPSLPAPAGEGTILPPNLPQTPEDLL